MNHINYFPFPFNLISANPCLNICPRYSNLARKACFTPHTKSNIHQYKLVRISVFDKAVLSLPPGSASTSYHSSGQFRKGTMNLL